MDYYSSHISKLIEELSKLPGVGAKSAQRLAFHIIGMSSEQVESLSKAIKDAKGNVNYCKECYTLTDGEVCPICASEKRSWKTQGIWQHMKRPESIMEYIMFCMGQFRQCLE